MFMVMYMDVDWKGTQKLNVIWSAGFMSILKFKVFFIFFPYPMFWYVDIWDQSSPGQFSVFSCCYFKLTNINFLSPVTPYFLQSIKLCSFERQNSTQVTSKTLEPDCLILNPSSAFYLTLDKPLKWLSFFIYEMGIIIIPHLCGYCKD